MTRDYFIELYDQHYWAHHRVWSCIMTLTDEQFDYELNYSRGSVRSQSVHVLLAEHMWFRYLTTGLRPVLTEADFPKRSDIQTGYTAIEREARAYIEHLTPEELAREVHHPMAQPREYLCAVHQVLTHLVQHGLDHRAQILAGLHQFGAPTVEQGYLHYAYEKRGYTL